MLPSICAGGNEKIIIMKSAGWHFTNNYPSTDYLSQLRTYTSTCDFYGIPYDVLTYESATNETLNQYSAIVHRLRGLFKTSLKIMESMHL